MTDAGQTAEGGWRYIAPYLRAYRVRLAGCVALALVQSVSLLPIAWLVRRAFDSVIRQRQVGELIRLGAEVLLLTLAAGCVTLITRYAALRTTKLAISAMRRDLVLHTQALPRARHDALRPAALHTLLVQDTQMVDVMLNAAISTLLPAMVLDLALLATMAVIHLPLLLLLVLMMPVLYATNRRLGRVVKARVADNREAFARFSDGVQFMLRRLDLTRYQAAEAAEARRQHENIETLRVDSGRMAWLQTAYGQAQTGTVMFAGILILVVGGVEVSWGRLSVGSLMSFYVATALLNSSLQQVFSAVPQVIEGVESLRALSRFAGESVAPPYAGTGRPAIGGRIELRGVAFGYGARRLLEGVSVELTPGSMTAIVGANGEGKTTIARLIMGLYRPQGGTLFADGVAYDEIDMTWLRRHIAFSPQDPIIFAGTIWENLVYGLDAVDREAVLDACRMALVDEFVQRLPQGYETMLDDEGGVISGGQRQRIAIARALSRRPRMLILDEPTNHLDERAAKHLLKTLRGLAGAPAVLVITQDRELAAALPRRLALHQGALVDTTVGRAVATMEPEAVA